MDTDELVRITDAAREMVLDIRSGEENGTELALWLEVSGSANGTYGYDMWFQQASDAAPGDVAIGDETLKVIVAASSIDKLRGATLDVGGGDAGLVMLNPNT
ncbi:MAG: hypothetical protein ACRD0B_10465, partial [Acidimicrobiales bacterium]